MKKSRLFVAAAFAVVSFSTCSFATVTQSLGVGSAVSSIDASADFESISALNENPYAEGERKPQAFVNTMNTWRGNFSTGTP